MKRSTKARLSTIVGCVIGGVTLTGPLAGDILADWQCNRGLCPHGFHRHRYRQQTTRDAVHRAEVSDG